MIRYTFIQNKVLEIYQSLPELKFPIDIHQVINTIPNCRLMTYQTFSEINDCSIDDVITLCESTSGCTHFDIFQNRYLILYNDSTDHYNNMGRQLWTCGHEIGHIKCEHMAYSIYAKLSENGFQHITDKQYESEADFFSATLLCPFPICRELNIKSAQEIQAYFGLSTEASQIRYNKYLEWQRSHRKTTWENDMKRLFRNFSH